MFKDVMNSLNRPLPTEEKLSSITTPFKSSILKNIGKYLLSINDEPNHRSPGYHASSLYDVCVREEVLAKLNKVEEKEIISADLRMKFLFGTYVHSMIQDSILGPAGLIHGAWKCRGCSSYDKNTSAIDCIYSTYPTEPCECGDTRWGYVEPKMRIAVPGVPDLPEWNIVGATDGLTDTEVLDIKTISAKGVDDLKKAFNSIDSVKDWMFPDETEDWTIKAARKYVAQINLYMYGFNKNSGFLLYVPKDKVDSFKDWIQIPVKRNDAIIEAMFKKVKLIYDAVNEERTNVKRICTSPYSYRSRDCALKDLCFTLGE